MTRQLEEPDVTPLINVNLVILVMTLLIASHAARLLPLVLPKAQGARTALVGTEEAVVLRVEAGTTYRLGERASLSAEALPGEIARLPDGTVVLVSMDPKAPYGSLVRAVDCLLARRTVQVAFGQPGVTSSFRTWPQSAK
ncbi:MAG TPA: biopolymer transporter ExbD [Planctomycetota bacterium]|nr:biopolymer transporter ExbD [Planctomycetota bacterium]